MVYLATFDHPDLSAVRSVIRRIPRSWLVWHLDAVAREHVRDADDAVYRRLLELYSGIDFDLAVQLAKEAATSDDPEIAEVGSDFLPLPAPLSAAAAARAEDLARLEPSDLPFVQEGAELVLRRLADQVVGWLAAPDPYLMAHLSSLAEAAYAVRGPAADPARALGVFVASIGSLVSQEAVERRTAATDQGAGDAYRGATTELIAKPGRADEARARARFGRASNAYARLLLLTSARSFHQGATFYTRQRARLMLDDLDWAARHPDVTATPPKPEMRRLVEAFPSVLLAFDAANDPDREEPLLTAVAAAQPLVPAWIPAHQLGAGHGAHRRPRRRERGGSSTAQAGMRVDCQATICQPGGFLTHTST